MTKKTGASEAKIAETQEAPAERFIPKTDYGKLAEQSAPAEAKGAARTEKTEHTQMDIEDYLKVLRTLGVQDEKRENFFGRLLIRTFEHKLVNPGEKPEEEGKLSRAVLPGFFTVLHILLGRSLIERYQETVKSVIKRTNGNFENIDWNKVYGDQEAKLITLDTLVALALHLESIEESANWFVDLVNDNAQALDATIEKSELDWKLTQSAFRDLLKDLFSELHETLMSENGRLKMTLRHGAETCIKVVDFLTELNFTE